MPALHTDQAPGGSRQGWGQDPRGSTQPRLSSMAGALPARVFLKPAWATPSPRTASRRRVLPINVASREVDLGLETDRWTPQQPQLRGGRQGFRAEGLRVITAKRSRGKTIPTESPAGPSPAGTKDILTWS